MKYFYLKLILAFCFLLTNSSVAQTQINLINSSGCGDWGFSGWIEGPYQCSINGQLAVDLGSFPDTNIAGLELATMSLKIYFYCDGDFEVFLNGALVRTHSTAGTTCACPTIESNPNITKNIQVTVTPAIVAAYVIGGVNTLSVTTRVLSVEQFNYDTIKVYLNPTSDFITITGLNNTMNYSIHNVLGIEILNGTINDYDKIDIKNFSTGLYFLKFENGDTHKFIK